MTDAQSLTRALGGKWYRRYGVACCPSHGDRRPSLTLADGTDGRLLLNCKSGCAFTEVLAALRERGLIDPTGRPQPPDADELARRKAEDEAFAIQQEKRALNCWKECQPIHGTIAETYLRGRGISCALPDTLRFHPDCWHGATARQYPAMVALIKGNARAAIHRTYLRPDGSGKAAIDPPKAMLGTAKGGAVRLTRAQGPLVVAEGIETALSLACGLLRAPATIWAALSAPGVAGLRLPNRTDRLTIAPDGDDAGRDAANSLAVRATALGWRVSLLSAPDGRDWNDILMQRGAA